MLLLLLLLWGGVTYELASLACVSVLQVSRSATLSVVGLGPHGDALDLRVHEESPGPHDDDLLCLPSPKVSLVSLSGPQLRLTKKLNLMEQSVVLKACPLAR